MNDNVLQGKLLALFEVVAYLLARDAANTGVSFNEIHAALVTTVASACDSQKGKRDGIEEFEAAACSELDALFSTASILLPLISPQKD